MSWDCWRPLPIYISKPEREYTTRRGNIRGLHQTRRGNIRDGCEARRPECPGTAGGPCAGSPRGSYITKNATYTENISNTEREYTRRMRSAEAWMSWDCWRPLRRMPLRVYLYQRLGYIHTREYTLPGICIPETRVYSYQRIYSSGNIHTRVRVSCFQGICQNRRGNMRLIMYQANAERRGLDVLGLLAPLAQDALKRGGGSRRLRRPVAHLRL